ncbi:MAG TPA: hypothetical protein VGU63_14875 [Candidatus Acidoferrales bacterium]|nr:hypothetical protein [Candidatus Acidoferrales bacterium]
MLTDGANSYGHNAESEIKSAAGVTYTYDDFGARCYVAAGPVPLGGLEFGSRAGAVRESDQSANAQPLRHGQRQPGDGVEDCTAQIRAYLLIKRHGAETCKLAHPPCDQFPVASLCPFYLRTPSFP